MGVVRTTLHVLCAATPEKFNPRRARERAAGVVRSIQHVMLAALVVYAYAEDDQFCLVGEG